LSESIKLIEKILSEAKEKAAFETKTMQFKADEVLIKAEEKAAKILKKAVDNAKVEAVDRKRRVKSVYDLAHKKDVLSMKREVLDTVFEKAIDDFATLDKAAYKEFMLKLLLSCSPDGKGSIKVSKNDTAKLDTDFLNKANDALKGAVGAGNITLESETCDKKGGFIYFNGGMEMDCSVEAVITLKREGCETQVAQILFEEE